MNLFYFIFMQVTNNEVLPTADTPPCDDSETENTVTDVRQDDKDNFVDAMDDLGSGKDGAETFDEQEAPDGVKSPRTGEAVKSGPVPAPATADVATAPVIPEVTKSDVVTAPLNAEADIVKVDAPPSAGAPDREPSPLISQLVPATTLFVAAPSRQEDNAAEETEDPASTSQDLGKTS
jgi:hypothetical protein